MRRTVAQRFVKRFFAPVFPQQGRQQADQIEQDGRAQHPYIAPGSGVAAVVEQQQIFRQRQPAAEQRQQQNGGLRGLLGRRFPLFLQLLQLAAVETGQQGGVCAALVGCQGSVRHGSMTSFLSGSNSFIINKLLKLSNWTF